MSDRKFVTEFALNSVVSKHLLLQQDSLDDIEGILKENNFNPHIYFICKRPRVTIKPNSLKITEDTIEIVFKQQIQDQYTEIPIRAKNHQLRTDYKLNTEYPYTEFEILEANGEVLLSGKSSILLQKILQGDKPQLTDLEVLYVGQSFGLNGSRDASDRLKSHSTLQNIYAEAINKSPDSEIWLIISSFENPFLLIHIDGRAKNCTSTLEDDDEHINEVISHKMNEQQKVNFTEAALIRYFQPRYNKIYKDTFPDPNHVTYSECYSIDLNTISVELQTEELSARLWSDNRPPSDLHFCMFPLHSRSEREYMFEFARLGEDPAK
ncbi:hypothetical protein [Salmonella enterica]|uniref:Uncharacterized protein n=2 Tax=Salmonella enterica TaxID=28901 RepID=A0A5Y2T003_SALET|nr:hypothetical protein [Salmonella enterica]EBW6150160.1 hypothetical protein [Salmonella enterica subsp. enterica serovar Cremieu]ECF7650012.1 hypothetical protein [Salmonella enterica subsp. enterica]ECK8266463.1 hypothetical protein [Salmonella enterica subsp. enterica serovar Typhimurium]EED4913222.1 hypothetical protein [Salmonella enterica subsp. enterica serovar Newport]EIK7910289.1 hypothetical protein [Escherichia coli]